MDTGNESYLFAAAWPVDFGSGAQSEVALLPFQEHCDTTGGSMGGILLLFIVAPHVALGFSWVFWGKSPIKFQDPKWRSGLLFSGLLACSLNVFVFWSYVIWLRFHETDANWWEGRDRFELVSDLLVGLAILAAIFGKGRARLPVLLAAAFGFLIWIIGHVGVL
jgi:hypothetical protein